MDRSFFVVLVIVALLFLAAALFYINPGENHRAVAVGLCELKCQNVTASNSSINDYCAAQNISFGYACAISNAKLNVCNSTNAVFVSSSCQLE
jgi:hypothetical protein